MKKLLLVFAAATMVFFCSCRHEDFDLLKHPIHVQGGASLHLGAPIGNGEMTVDDLFSMINDPTIDSLLDTNQSVITLHFETAVNDTVTGSGLNINTKKIIGKLRGGELPWGRNRANQRWTPRRTANDRTWSPRRSGRVNMAKSGGFAPKTGTPDNIFSIADTISYSFDLDMLTNSSFFNDADFELNTVSLDLNINLNAICPEAARHYLDDYITFTVDSVMIFYTTEEGVQQFNHHPFDGNTSFVYGHDSPTGIGITQQTLVIPFPNVNIAEIVNAKPSSMTARFRYKIDVARSLVLDEVANVDTTGIFLTGIDLNTVSLNDLSNIDSATIMNDVQNNLANTDTLWLINYLIPNANIDTSDPQTILNYLGLADTGAVLALLSIDTNEPMTILAAAGIDTNRDALAAAANVDLNDTNALINAATNGAVTSMTDTLGIIFAATNGAGVIINPLTNDTVIDTSYFISQITNGQGVQTNGDLDTNWLIQQACPGATGDNDTNFFLSAAVGVNYPPSTPADTNTLLSGAIGINYPITDSSSVAALAGIPSLTDTAAMMTMFNCDTAGILNPTDFIGLTPAQIQHKRDSVMNAARQTIEDSVKNRVSNYIRTQMEDYIKQNVTNYLETQIHNFVTNQLTPYVKTTLQDYVTDVATDYITDRIGTYYRDTIITYLENRVYEYVYDVIQDSIEAAMVSRLENFTTLKDNLVGIMDTVSQSSYACNATVSVNIPFEMKIGSLAHPIDVELWKDGEEPIDVDALLNKLPTFVGASIDPSYFNMRVDNMMPLEFIVTAELLDANKVPLATIINGDTIKPGPLVQVPGNPTCWQVDTTADPTVSVISAEMDQAKLRKLKDAKYVRMNLVLSSDNKFVYVRREDKMSFRAYLQANASANVDLTLVGRSTGIIPGALHNIW